MTLQTLTSIRDAIRTRRRQAELATRAAKMHTGEGEQYQRLGFNPAPFALRPEPEVTRAMAVLLGQLARCKEVCDNHGMALRLVTLPAFPKAFYDSQRGSNWTMRIGDYDYLKPERELAEYARARGIPVLSMGEYVEAKKLDVETIAIAIAAPLADLHQSFVAPAERFGGRALGHQ